MKLNQMQVLVEEGLLRVASGDSNLDLEKDFDHGNHHNTPLVRVHVLRVLCHIHEKVVVSQTMAIHQITVHPLSLFEHDLRPDLMDHRETPECHNLVSDLDLGEMIVCDL